MDLAKQELNEKTDCRRRQLLMSAIVPLVATLRMQCILVLHFDLQSDTFWNAMTHVIVIHILG